jgi:hypothetical protein
VDRGGDIVGLFKQDNADRQLFGFADHAVVVVVDIPLRGFEIRKTALCHC